jgi:hypothetical protein
LPRVPQPLLPAHVSPELVATLLQTERGDTAALKGTDNQVSVSRSFRAAIIAGLVVAVLNAAANATFASHVTHELGIFSSFATSNVPILVSLLLAALWSGARTSALCLLIAHRLLAALARTSTIDYVVAGGGVALLYALAASIFGSTPSVHTLIISTFSGMTAGFIYRFFAATRRLNDNP